MEAWEAQAAHLDVTLVEGASDYEDNVIDHVPICTVVQEFPQDTISL